MKSIAILFPGQASQAVGMGVDFRRAYPRVAALFDAASDRLGFDLAAVTAAGPPRRLAETVVAQPAIFVLSVAIADLLVQRGIMPSITAGHSLGEFTATVVAGAVDFEAGLDLVIERSRRMHEINLAVDGGMVAVSGLERAEIERLLDGLEDEACVANINAPSQIVVSGTRPALRDVVDRASGMGGKGVWLDVAGPYHSPLMLPAAKGFASIVDALAIAPPAVPVLANADGRVLSSVEDLRDELRTHMTAPVDWPATLRAVATAGTEATVEVGPGKVLKGLALRNGVTNPHLLTGTVADFDRTCRMLEGR